MGTTGGFGCFRGPPHSNVNLGVKKSSGPTERFNAEVSFNFTNVLNHNRFLDSTFNIASGERPDGVSTIRCLKGKARLAFPFLFLKQSLAGAAKKPCKGSPEGQPRRYRHGKFAAGSG